MSRQHLASFFKIVPWRRDPNCNRFIFHILFEVVLCQVSSGINSLIPHWNPCQPQPNCRAGHMPRLKLGYTGRQSWIAMLYNEVLKRLVSCWHNTVPLNSIRIIRGFADPSIEQLHPIINVYCIKIPQSTVIVILWYSDIMNM